MIDGTRLTKNAIRWGMVGGGRGSQIGYVHRSRRCSRPKPPAPTASAA